ncbi:MAG: T9SS type A sorting domain-containing protein [Candidatus Kapaibacterium sp.]
MFNILTSSEIQFRLSPLFIKASFHYNDFGRSYIQIFDVLGIEVMSIGSGLYQSQQRIDISHLPAGVYFVKIGDKVEKFVKM